METYQLWEGVSRKGRPVRRLIQGYAISDDDPETDAREFFDPKTKDLHKVADVHVAVLTPGVSAAIMGECWLQERE